MPASRREASVKELALEELCGAEETTLSTWLSEGPEDPHKPARQFNPDSEVQHYLLLLNCQYRVSNHM